MNILFLSGTHPATPHISGVRAARFAAELARRGHRCVLLCPALPDAAGEEEYETRARDHDWCRPLIVTVAEEMLAPAPRNGLVTAAKLLVYGGKRVSLARAMRARADTLSRAFLPDMLWATFGSLETVFAARRLARARGIRWVFDVKDNVDNYIPRRLHGLLARRVRGFGALTSNADLHAQAAGRWLGVPAQTIYSGVDDCFFVRQAPAPQDAGRYVTLVGGLYHRDLVDGFVEGVAVHNRDPAHAPLEIIHIGSQLDLLQDVAARHAGVTVRGSGYIDTSEMARICQSALANAYVFHGQTFHHKLFELLACRRPVVAFGGELAESTALAAHLGRPLETPQSPAALAALLAAIGPATLSDVAPRDRFFTWPDQAAMLERTMKRLMAHD